MGECDLVYAYPFRPEQPCQDDAVQKTKSAFQAGKGGDDGGIFYDGRLVHIIYYGGNRENMKAYFALLRV